MAGTTTKVVERLGRPMVGRDVVPRAALLVEPEPPLALLPEVVLPPHADDRAHPRDAVSITETSARPRAAHHARRVVRRDPERRGPDRAGARREDFPLAVALMPGSRRQRRRQRPPPIEALCPDPGWTRSLPNGSPSRSIRVARVESGPHFPRGSRTCSGRALQGQESEEAPNQLLGVRSWLGPELLRPAANDFSRVQISLVINTEMVQYPETTWYRTIGAPRIL